MNLAKISTLLTIGKIIDKYAKAYCTASQARLMELLDEIHGIKIKRRALNYHLADLRDEGLIISIRRTYRREDGTLCLRTSATCLTADGWNRLAKMGWTKAVVWWKRIATKYRDYQEKAQQEKSGPEKTPGPDLAATRKWIDKLKATLGADELEEAHERAKEILASARAREAGA